MAAVVSIPLHRVAHGRSGDKGNIVNISVIAYQAEWFPTILEQVTVERVAQTFQNRNPSLVQRYVLSRLCALNFVLHDVLDGGVNASLNLDAHGKSLSFMVLGIEIQAPADLLNVLDVSNGAL